MNDTRHDSQSLGKVTLLCVLALLLARPLTAQSAVDFKIMVSGPWSYVTDPLKPGRLFLVAAHPVDPKTDHHQVFIFSGPQAHTFCGLKHTLPGNYDLDFDSSQKMSYTYAGLEAPIVCKGSVSKSTVKNVLANASGTDYVISLPTPDAYSTYDTGSQGPEGYSESKVSLIDSSVDASVPPQLYTTWMVLHYGRDQYPANMTLTGSKPLPAADYSGRPGISIVLGDPNRNDEDRNCDAPSLHSFLDRNELWQIGGYARFPRSRGPGDQIHYSYDYNCSTSKVAMSPIEPKDHDPVVCSESAGSADCHTCQMSINGAGPKAP